jgi:hypothetical protein
MRIDGGCHCGAIRLELDWPAGETMIPARACSCTFCTAHGAAWTSHPSAHLAVRIRDGAHVSAYAFGTETATFHVCGTCGVVPLASCEIEGNRYAVVNVNALRDLDETWLRRSSANVEGEEVTARLTRRQRNWIGRVHIG